METLEHKLVLVEWVNRAFAPLFELLGIHADPNHPLIPNYLVMGGLIVLSFLVLGLLLRSRLSVEHPSRFQIVIEDLVSGLLRMMEEWLGPQGRRFMPLIGALGGFILVGNYLGFIPGLMAPTSNINVTVGCAITTWVYYHLQGIRAQGVIAYIKHFAGPPGLPVFVVPVFFVIEIISHISRVLSLSLRLFGNIFGEETLIAILALLLPFFLPLPIMLLGILTSGLQAFIFVLLSIIYLQGAVIVEHHDAHPADAGHGHAAAAAA
jgi:F-type H+-transporting ATPase subunit a